MVRNTSAARVAPDGLGVFGLIVWPDRTHPNKKGVDAQVKSAYGAPVRIDWQNLPIGNLLPSQSKSSYDESYRNSKLVRARVAQCVYLTEALADEAA